MKFSLIIPTKDRQEIISKGLDLLSLTNNLTDIEVIIINDSDQDLKLGEKYRYITVSKNNSSGVASARNFGASLATNDWLIFMDDDMLVQPDTFLKLIPFCALEDHCLNINWVYPKFVTRQLKDKPFLRYLHHFGFDSLEGWNRDIVWQNEVAFKVNGITSQFLLIHKNTFNKVGGYNTSFPFAGFEDHDFSGRLKKHGVSVIIDPQNVIFHNEADRLEVENWLERKRRGAITRRVAVHLGYPELGLHYSLPKKTFYYQVYRFRKTLINLLNRWPNKPYLDQKFFLLVNLLLGTYSCIGYTSEQAQNFIQSLNGKD